jgi:hypothetical protein
MRRNPCGLREQGFGVDGESKWDQFSHERAPHCRRERMALSRRRL